jgi:hypothetical protein
VWQLLEQWEFELLELLVVVVLQVAVHPRPWVIAAESTLVDHQQYLLI